MTSRRRGLLRRLDVAPLPGPLAGGWSAVRRERAARRYTTGLVRRRYPATPSELRASGLMQERWYYSVELLPGHVTAGQSPADVPMLPRMLLRRCEVADGACLDVGTMEGLVPVLLRKRGAEVLAVDFSYDNAGKVAAVQHYHGVGFELRAVGLMYSLPRQLGSRSFDLVNLSGLLYHVFSPLHLLAAIRPLLRRNGLLVVSTLATLDPFPVMDFNARGRLWGEGNTFWFPSVALLDYVLRYLRLVPVDCLFRPIRQLPELEKPAGYVSVVCRAVDRVAGDPWLVESMRASWEYHGVVDWERADSRPWSEIRYAVPDPPDGLDLHAAVTSRPAVGAAAELRDSYVLTRDAID